jgi:glycosyltransferase involved in cell wall biosynthesis
MLEVSVILPVYNCEKYIGEAVNSILSQKFDSFELIVINDGSKDDTLSILNAYNDSRLRIITNDANKGLVHSLNLAIEIAEGQFICRMDADDICDEYRLIKQYQFLIKNPDINVVGCQGYYIDENSKILNKKRWRKNKLLIEFFCLLGESPVGHPFSMIRKNSILEVGVYREQYFRAEDKDLWLRIFKGGGKFYNLKDNLFYYRIHPNQITDSKIRVQQISILVIKDFYKSIEVDDTFLGEKSLDAFLNFKNYQFNIFPLCFSFMIEIANKMKYNMMKRSILILLYFLFFMKQILSNMLAHIQRIID